MSVPVQTGPSFGVGDATAVAVIEGGGAGALGRNYDVSADGKRFLMVRSAAPTSNVTPPQLHVVLNWGEELQRLAPARR
jgi:hypothetical protein